MLDGGAEMPLTLVSGPAGSGKTTLLAQWAERQAHIVAWVTLSHDDNDSMRYWTRVAAAIGDGYARAGRCPPLELAAFLPHSAAAALLTLAEQLITAEERLTIVLDDAGLVDSRSIYAEVAECVEQLPLSVSFILSTRVDPPLPLARLRAAGRLNEIRSDELAFTAEETRSFLHEMLGPGLTRREIDTLHARMEGWAAGVRLAALALAASDDRSRLAAEFGGTHPYIFDYIVDEVLASLPDELVDFMVHTSIAPSLSASLCQALTGVQHGQSILRRLKRENMFLVSLDHQSRWFRYQHLFAEVLQRRLEDEGTDAIRELHRRATEWYLQRGLVRDAVHHALGAGEYALAADAIERLADETLWERGDIAELLTWLEILPVAIVRARPRLLMAHAWALALTGQLRAIERPLRLAERSLGVLHDGDIERVDSCRAAMPVEQEEVYAERRESTSLVQRRADDLALGEIAAVRAVAAGLQIDTRQLASWSVEAITHAPENQFLKSVVALSRGRAFDLGADVSSAITAYAEARALSERIENTHIHAVATSRLAELWAVQGELHAAADLHRRVLADADHESDHRSAVGAMAHVGLGALLYEWNDLQAAATYFDGGMTRATRWGHLETLKGAYFGLACIRYAEGATAEAFELLREAEDVAGHSNAPRSIVWVHAMQARFALRSGDLAQAERWAQMSPLRVEHDPFHMFTGEYATLVRLYLAQHRHDDALGLLNSLFEVATAQHRVGFTIELLILQGMAHGERGAMRSALLSFRKALSLAAPEGYLRTFLDEGPAVADLLQRARLDSTMPPYLHVVLEAFKQDEAHTVPSEIRGAMLTRRELEVLRHIAAGESNAEIAALLVLSLATVKRHVSNIFDKLGVSSRTLAVARARQRGVL
jgi:LuxR family maltose regulon positive regulatory protein